jgi:hypothetical protein
MASSLAASTHHVFSILSSFPLVHNTVLFCISHTDSYLFLSSRITLAHSRSSLFEAFVSSPQLCTPGCFLFSVIPFPRLYPASSFLLVFPLYRGTGLMHLFQTRPCRVCLSLRSCVCACAHALLRTPPASSSCAPLPPLPVPPPPPHPTYLPTFRSPSPPPTQSVLRRRTRFVLACVLRSPSCTTATTAFVFEWVTATRNSTKEQPWLQIKQSLDCEYRSRVVLS